MPPITALLHCENDALRLGRTLEMLLPCSEILIVDHRSLDSTRRVARAYGARIMPTQMDAHAKQYLQEASHDWILCMQPGESITENLQASLYDFSALPLGGVKETAFCVHAREQAGDGRWQASPESETRLIPRVWTQWQGWLPAPDLPATSRGVNVLEGELLRFAWP